MTTASAERASGAPSVVFSYGSIAFPLSPRSKAADNDNHTHRWTVFVRGAENQDITYAVAKVVFHLHESFNPPIRELTTPPFVVTETGWGVFDVPIEIYLRDPAAPSIRLVHSLKLHHDGPTGMASVPAPLPNTTVGRPDPVVSEFYDEVVFNVLPADETARRAILAGPGRDPPPYPHQEYLTVFTDGADVAAVESARVWIQERKEELQARLTKGMAERGMLMSQLEAVGMTV